MLGIFWAYVGPCWRYVGRIFALCWAYVGQADVDVLVFLGTARPVHVALAGLCWAYVGLCWAYVGPLGAMLGRSSRSSRSSSSRGGP